MPPSIRFSPASHRTRRPSRRTRSFEPGRHVILCADHCHRSRRRRPLNPRCQLDAIDNFLPRAWAGRQIQIRVSAGRWPAKHALPQWIPPVYNAPELNGIRRMAKKPLAQELAALCGFRRCSVDIGGGEGDSNEHVQPRRINNLLFLLLAEIPSKPHHPPFVPVDSASSSVVSQFKFCHEERRSLVQWHSHAKSISDLRSFSQALVCSRVRETRCTSRHRPDNTQRMESVSRAGGGSRTP